MPNPGERIAEGRRLFHRPAPSCGGLSADLEEKRVTQGSDHSELSDWEQLDCNGSKQRRLLAHISQMTELFRDREPRFW